MLRETRVRFSAMAVAAMMAIEAPDVYQFLADVDGSDTSFTDDGTIIPDYTLRLPESSGYYGWTMWPTPSSDTEIDLNVIERPPLLLNDYDAILVKPEYSDIVAHFCAAVHAFKSPVGSNLKSKKACNSRPLLFLVVSTLNVMTIFSITTLYPSVMMFRLPTRRFVTFD